AGSKVTPRSHRALVRPPGISGYLFPTDETERLGTTPGREPRSNSSCGLSGTGDEIRVAAEEVSFHRLPQVSVAFKRSDFCASSSVNAPHSPRPAANHWQSRALARQRQERGVAVPGGFRPGAGASFRSLVPFPAPPHRTVREVFPHTALREPSPDGIQLVCAIRPWITYRPASLQ